MSIRKPPLEEHIRKKKVLQAPLNALLNVQWSSAWYPHQVANYLWLLLLLNEDVRDVTFLSFRQLINSLSLKKDQIVDSQGLPLSHLHLEKMDDEVVECLLNCIFIYPKLIEAIQPLQFIADLPGRRHFEKYFKSRKIREEDIECLKQTISYSSGQDSLPATDIAWFVQGANLMSGKMMLTEHLAEGVINRLNQYPDSKNPIGDGGTFRASRNSFFNMLPEDATKELIKWSDSFWSWAYDNSECEFIRLNVPENWSKKFMSEISLLYKELDKKIGGLVENHDGFDLDEKSKNRRYIVLARYLQSCEVLFGALAMGPNLSTLTLIGLRTMFEGFVTSKKLEMDANYSDFIQYGRGKLKLISHKGGSKSFLERTFLQEAEFYANEEVAEMSVDVDLGSFFKGGIRQVSIDTGYKDLYDELYDITSTFSNGEWPALRLRYLTPCTNSLHKSHLMPVMNLIPAYATIGLMIKILDHFAEEFSDLGLTKFDKKVLPKWIEDFSGNKP